MITKYTEKQKALAEINTNIHDDFNDIDARLEVLTSMNLADNEALSYGVYLLIRDVQDHLKAIQYRIDAEV